VITNRTPADYAEALYPARQDWDKIARVLKPVYTAPTEEAALERFAEFADTWGRKYPAIVRLGRTRGKSSPRSSASTPGSAASSAPPMRTSSRMPASGERSRHAVTSPTSRPPGKGQARWAMRWKTALNAFDITFDGRLSAAHQ
jgi:transposase-like protein